MKSTDFLGKLSTIRSPTKYSHFHTHTHPYSNRILYTGCSVSWFQFSAFTQIFIFIFSSGFDSIVVGPCLVWWQMVFLFAIFFTVLCVQKNICKYHAIRANVSTAQCIPHIYKLISTQPIHHSTFKGNSQHLILFAYGLIFVFRLFHSLSTILVRQLSFDEQTTRTSD